MGTRSLTFVYTESRAKIINMYRQYDGYMEGHGQELADFLSGFEITNGFGQPRAKLANGMSCLAAQMISHFKTETGQFYLHPVTEKDLGQDYTYHVYRDRVRVESYDRQVFDGTWAEFHEATHRELA